MDYLGWTAFFVKHVSFTLGKCMCPDFSHPLTLTDGGSGGIMFTDLAAPDVPQMCLQLDVGGVGKAGIGPS